MARDDRSTADGDNQIIGFCRMEIDGTLVLELRATTADSGMVGHGRMSYAKDHPQYLDILEHVGPIQPGETKPVAPWPD